MDKTQDPILNALQRCGGRKGSSLLIKKIKFKLIYAPIRGNRI